MNIPAPAPLLGALLAIALAPLAPCTQAADDDRPTAPSPEVRQIEVQKSPPGPPGQARSDAIRARIHELEKKAADVKAAGDLDALAKIKAEITELRSQAVRNRPVENPERRAAIDRRLDSLRERLLDLKAAGKHDEALELRREIEKLEIGARQDIPLPDRSRKVLRPNAGDEPDRRATLNEDQLRRREHVEIALEHLRAAGYLDMAERIGQELRRREGDRAGQAPIARPRAGSDPAPMQAEIAELRQAVRELKRRLEEVASDRR
jgi:hypothetical protein